MPCQTQSIFYRFNQLDNAWNGNTYDTAISLVWNVFRKKQFSHKLGFWGVII